MSLAAMHELDETLSKTGATGDERMLSERTPNGLEKFKSSVSLRTASTGTGSPSTGSPCDSEEDETVMLDNTEPQFWTSCGSRPSRTPVEGHERQPCRTTKLDWQRGRCMPANVRDAGQLLSKICREEWPTALVALVAAYFGAGFPSLQGAMFRVFFLGFIVLLCVSLIEGHDACERSCNVFAVVVHHAFVGPKDAILADRFVAMTQGLLLIWLTVVSLVFAPFFTYRVALHMSRASLRTEQLYRSLHDALNYV